jgi:hypothetical protein
LIKPQKTDFNMRKLKLLLLFFSFLSMVGFAQPVGAIAYMVELDTAFSNYDPGDPGYIGSYGTVNFIDIGNDIVFTITFGSDLGTNPDLHEFYFNTTDDIAGLSIDIQTPTSPIGSLDYQYNTNSNSHRPDGDGYFDGVIEFGSGDPVLNSIIFTLTADTPLDINNFIAQSVGGNKGAFTFAAHWQNTNTSAGSEFVGGNPVPLPGALCFLGSGIIGLAGLRSKRFIERFFS